MMKSNILSKLLKIATSFLLICLKILVISAGNTLAPSMVFIVAFLLSQCAIVMMLEIDLGFVNLLPLKKMLL